MKKISEKTIIDNGFRKCIERIFDIWDNKEASFLVCAKSGKDSGIGVLGITHDRTFILVDEYRVGPEQIVRSCVVWDVEDDWNLEDNAKREFLEETGYTFETLLLIIELINNPYFVWSTNYYLATWCTKIQSQLLEDTESITCITLTQEELESNILDGKIRCPYLISLYYTAKAKTNNFTTF